MVPRYRKDAHNISPKRIPQHLNPTEDQPLTPASSLDLACHVPCFNWHERRSFKITLKIPCLKVKACTKASEVDVHHILSSRSLKVLPPELHTPVKNAQLPKRPLRIPQTGRSKTLHHPRRLLTYLSPCATTLAMNSKTSSPRRILMQTSLLDYILILIFGDLLGFFPVPIWFV